MVASGFVCSGSAARSRLLVLASRVAATEAGLAAAGDAAWSSRILVQHPPSRYLRRRRVCADLRFGLLLAAAGLKRNPYRSGSVLGTRPPRAEPRSLTCSPPAGIRGVGYLIYYLRPVEDCQSRASGPRLCLELGSWWDDRPHGWASQSCS